MRSQPPAGSDHIAGKVMGMGMSGASHQVWAGEPGAGVVVVWSTTGRREVCWAASEPGVRKWDLGLKDPHAKLAVACIVWEGNTTRFMSEVVHTIQCVDS